MIGVVAGAVFGGAWGIAGSAGLSGAARRWVTVLVISATAALLAAALALRPAGWRLSHAFDAPVYMVAVLAEAILIPTSAVLLRRRGQRTWVPVAAAAIVALHFIGLWLATGTVAFLVLTAALLAPPVIAVLSYRRLAARWIFGPLAITGLGSFAVLFLAALSGFLIP